MLLACLFGGVFDCEVILTSCISTSEVDAQCCNAVFLLTPLWIKCFFAMPQHWNERQDLGRRDCGKAFLC